VNIYVSNIAFNATDDDLRQLFESYGAVDTVSIITDRDTGQSVASASWKCPIAPPPKRPFKVSRARRWRVVL
jgi:RNA recognition motif-containing protein